MKRTILYLLLIVVLFLLAAACSAPPAPEPTATPTPEPTVTPMPEPTATLKPEVVKSFDASRLELPEGITIDKAGNIYVSLGPPLFAGGGFGEIWKISPDGTETTLAQFDGGPPAAGLAVDASANLYYAYPSDEEDTQGVYRLTADGDTERLPGTEAIILANGLAFDNAGNLYVSDSILGAIWRIPPDGSAELWLQHELLAGCLPDDPFGANGVALWEGNLYAANTGKGILVSIPILTDGSAGEPEKVAGVGDCDAEVKDLYGMDGIALDVEGNVYALLVLQNKLVKIDPTDGTFTTLFTDDDGLHNPASIVFGVGKDDQESIFFTNYAVLPPEPPTSLGPAVLKFDVGVPGLPLPTTVEDTEMEPAITSGFAEVNGTRLYYETAGDGEAVVFIHGFGGNTLSWNKQFTEFARQYHVVNYDMRGFGKSDEPTDQPYAHADDLKALLDYLEIESAHVIGHSFGGQIALNFALAYPEATQSLVLIEPDVPGLEGLPPPMPEEEAAFGAIFAALGEGDPAGAAVGLVDNHPIFAVSRDVPGVREYHLEVLAGYNWFHFQNEDPVAEPDPPVGKRLDKIVAPTLLFTGDSTTQYQAMEVDMLVEQLPNARKVVVENSDHFPQALYPDDFNARVLAFLEEVQ